MTYRSKKELGIQVWDEWEGLSFFQLPSDGTYLASREGWATAPHGPIRILSKNLCPQDLWDWRLGRKTWEQL